LSLPGGASVIGSAIAAARPDGNTTPTYPALAGALKYAGGWNQAHPDHITIVVLATDGEPTGCNPNEVSTIAAIAEKGFSSNPPVRTFVLGIGNLSALNQIARAGSGGTEDVILVGGADPGQAFLDALNGIRGGFACRYKLPVPPQGETLDTALVNVDFTPQGGGVERFPGVGSAADCAGQPGWYYDNPAAPNEIVLCPASCDRLSSVPGTVDVLLGCKTAVR